MVIYIFTSAYICPETLSEEWKLFFKGNTDGQMVRASAKSVNTFARTHRWDATVNFSLIGHNEPFSILEKFFWAVSFWIQVRITQCRAAGKLRSKAYTHLISMHWERLTLAGVLPDSATFEMSTSCSAAMKPRMEKTTKPAKKLVPLFIRANTNVSLRIGKPESLS